MRNYLTDHALENLWCEPSQDRQYIIKPARHTKNGGALRSAPVGWVRVPLPITDSTASSRFFHVYQLGQKPPSLLNIADNPGKWYSAEGLMETQGVLINVYLTNGAKIPPAYVWIQVTYDRNVLLAIENVPGMNLGTVVAGEEIRQARLDFDDIIVRLYSSAWFDSPQYAGINASLPKVNVVSQKVVDSNSFASFWSQCSVVNTQYDAIGLGVSRYYVDGFEVKRPMAYNPSIHYNRMLTMVRDTAIIAVKDFGKIVDLQSFTSLRDVGETKYILMSEPTDWIQYFDDIDFVMTKDNDRDQTVHFPIATGEEIRTLLHNAWAMPANKIASVMNDHDTLWSGLTDVRLRAYIRQGGHKFTLINEARHLKELIKMTREEILGALTGVSALVDEWRADNLESSAFSEVMSSSMEALLNDNTVIAEAYGYNAAVKLMSDPVKPVISSGGQLSVDVPRTGWMGTSETGNGERSFFTYNADGKLVGYFYNEAAYSPMLLPGVTGQTQTKAEVFPMKLSDNHDGCFYMQNVESLRLKTQGFRVYACAAPGGVPSESWTDVTDIGLDLYYTYDPVGTLANGYKPKITWDLSAMATAGLFGCVKVGGYVTMHKPDLGTTNYPGMVRFSVNTTQPGWSGGSPLRVQKLQPGRIDVFMGLAGQGAELLVEDIDYYVNWPEICICRVPPGIPGAGLEVFARLHGFCDPDTMEYAKPREVGFARGGWLSSDGEYDIRNDRAIIVSVGGKFMRRSEVRFAEDDTGPVVPDGRPFGIHDYQLPIEPFTELKTVPEWKAARVIDDTVQDYLDLRKDEYVPGVPFIEGDRWRLYSPFLSAILHAFDYGFLGAGQLEAPYESTDISDWVAPYLYLLDYDPCVQAFEPDYVEVRPHQYSVPRSVNVHQFDFLHKINLQFLGGKVTLSPSIVIGA